MKGKFLSLIISGFALWCGGESVQAQNLYDTFSDGDFYTAPVWDGDTASWSVVTDSDVAAGALLSHTLRLDAPTGGTGTAYLSTQPGVWGDHQEWGWFIGRRNQAYTATNRLYLWLYATESDLNSPTISGYRMMIGDNVSSGDKLFLQYVVNGTVHTTVVTSAGALTNGITDAGFLLRVTRNVHGLWTIHTSSLPDSSGGGAVAADIPDTAATQIVQGTGMHNALVPDTSGYMGVQCIFGTSANARTAAEIDQVFFTPLSALPATVALSVPAADTNTVAQGSSNILLRRIELSVSGEDAVISGLTVSTAGSYLQTDLTALRVFFSADTILDATDQVLSVKTTGLDPGSQIFPGFTPWIIPQGTTGYLFITADIAAGGQHGHTIYLDTLPHTAFSFSGNTSLTGPNPLPAGGIKTIFSMTPQPGDIRINQFHTGYNGAANEYVELVNLTDKALDLSLVSITYQSGGGGNSSAGGSLTGIIPPYAFWLLTSNTNTVVALGLTDSLAANGHFNSGFAATAGQLALVRISDNSIIDGVAYGTIAVNNLGVGATAPAPVSGQQGLRRVTDGSDSQDNATDFMVVPNTAVYLRNSGSRHGGNGALIPGGVYQELFITGNTLIGDSVFLIKQLSVSNHAHLHTGGLLTLKTDATARAYIAPVNGSISGTVITEQYIPQGNSAYRDLAPGVNTGTTIFHNWQEGGLSPTGYGIHIGGSTGTPGGVDPVTGFDYTASGAATMFQYTDTVWHAVISTNQSMDTLTAFRGYRIQVRGDRNTDLSAPSATPMPGSVTIRTNGTPVTGDVLITTSGTTAMGATIPSAGLCPYPGSYSMVANPYLAPVDFNSILANTTDLADMYWYFDPTLGTQGAYIVWDGSTNSGSGAGAVSGQYLQPGQAFFVRNYSALTTGPSLLFQESDKKTDTQPVAVFKTTSSDKLIIGLWKETGGMARGTDGCAIVFGSQYNAAITEEDAGKMANPNENIAVYTSNALLSIEKRPLPVSGDTIPLQLWQMETGGDYILHVDATMLNINGLYAYLYDSFLHTTTIFSTTGIQSIPFSVTQDPGSAANRFMIVFNSQMPLSLSPIRLKATAQTQVVQLEWEVTDNANTEAYIPERSGDGASFIPLTVVKAGMELNYSHTDKSGILTTQPVYYRIQRRKHDGGCDYSNTVVLPTGQIPAPEPEIYPNPVTNGIVSLYTTGLKQGTYKIILYDISGKVVYSHYLTYRREVEMLSLELGKQIPGTYILTIKGADIRIQKQLIIQ